MGQLWTMKCCYAEIVKKTYPWVPLGNFTLDFFNNPRKRHLLICDPLQLPEIPTGEDYQWAIFCVASIEYLCHRYDIACPDWIYGPEYSALSESWYMSETVLSDQIQRRYRETTPIEFAQRNIYCGAKVYMDKREEAEKLRRLMTA